MRNDVFKNDWDVESRVRSWAVFVGCHVGDDFDPALARSGAVLSFFDQGGSPVAPNDRSFVVRMQFSCPNSNHVVSAKDSNCMMNQTKIIFGESNTYKYLLVQFPACVAKENDCVFPLVRIAIQNFAYFR
jgi:hypothetical protein